MAGVWFRGREFITALSENVGFKTGLAVDEERLHAMIEDLGYGAYWPEDDDAVMRIRADEFEELFAGVLFRLGAGAPRRVVAPLSEVYFRNNKDDAGRTAVVEVLSPRFVEFLRESVAAATPGARIDPSPFIAAAGEEFRRGRGVTVIGTPQHGVVVTKAKELLQLARLGCCFAAGRRRESQVGSSS
jgi:hypothetical protein